MTKKQDGRVSVLRRVCVAGGYAARDMGVGCHRRENASRGGQRLASTIRQCSVCGTVTTGNAINRWHEGNCIPRKKHKYISQGAVQMRSSLAPFRAV
jgi:hypothetical protein